MRLLRSAFFALFWVALGLGMALFPFNGKTVWERLWSKTPWANKEAPLSLGSYTPEERANINKLIQGGL